jgi:DNA-binding NarL/FixJ family response regulator
MIRNPKNPKRRTARILIVDDHPVVREGLGLRISRQPDLEVCGEAADVAEALQLIGATNPDVAIVDISLKTGNGIDLIKRIRARNESVRILVWSMHNERFYAERALRAGAMGYINKEHATEKIIDALRQILNGKIYLSEPMADQLLNRAVGLSVPLKDHSPEDCLTDRELETFQLIGQGLETNKVAERMRVSPKTVETFRTRIKEKLKLKNVNELIQRAAQWVMENN